MSLRNVSRQLGWPSFFQYFRQFKENEGQSKSLKLGKAPGESLPLTRLQVLQVGVHVMSYNSVSEITTGDIGEENNYRERSNIMECISLLTGSVPQKMADGLQRVSAPCGI